MPPEWQKEPQEREQYDYVGFSLFGLLLTARHPDDQLDRTPRTIRIAYAAEDKVEAFGAGKLHAEIFREEDGTQCEAEYVGQLCDGWYLVDLVIDGSTE